MGFDVNVVCLTVILTPYTGREVVKSVGAFQFVAIVELDVSVLCLTDQSLVNKGCCSW